MYHLEWSSPDASKHVSLRTQRRSPVASRDYRPRPRRLRPSCFRRRPFYHPLLHLSRRTALDVGSHLVDESRTLEWIRRRRFEIREGARDGGTRPTEQCFTRRKKRPSARFIFVDEVTWLRAMPTRPPMAWTMN